MRRFLAPFLLLAILVLAACAPVISPTATRDAETVTISFTPTADVYAVTVSILNAVTDDERCVVLNEGRDLGCVIGDVAEDTRVSIVVTGPPGEVYCNVTGYIEPGMSLASFRVYPCS